MIKYSPNTSDCFQIQLPKGRYAKLHCFVLSTALFKSLIPFGLNDLTAVSAQCFNPSSLQKHIKSPHPTSTLIIKVGRKLDPGPQTWFHMVPYEFPHDLSWFPTAFPDSPVLCLASPNRPSPCLGGPFGETSSWRHWDHISQGWSHLWFLMILGYIAW